MGDRPVQGEYLALPLRKTRKGAGRVALRIALLYCLLAALWIFFSDYALHHAAKTLRLSAETEGHLQTAKGWLFVGATTVLLFVLIRSYLRAFQKAQSALDARIDQIAAQYKQLFDRNPFPMWVYDPADLRFLAVNDRAVEAYGYSRAEFLAMKVTDLCGPDGGSRMVEAAKTAPEGTRFAGLWRHCRKDGTVLDAEVISHWIDFDGAQARLVMSIDVTERLRAERALEDYRVGLERRVADRTAALSAANDRLRGEVEQRERAEAGLLSAKHAAEQSSAAKSTYLANTTHEIRTPLTSILGYADLLMDRHLPESQRLRYVEIVQQNASHLLKLVDDLLDLTRVEMGKITINWEHESPRDLAAQAVELVRPKADEKGIRLAVDVAADVPASFRADGVRLRQVLLNLLSNAIKFTEAGRVTLTVDVAPRPAINGHTAGRSIRFRVADTGIGIPAEHVQRIFEPFYQVDREPSRRHRGFGLGLAISRELLEFMGGSIAVSSTPGAGSTFVAELPLTEIGALATRPLPPAALDRIDADVLLAEDDPNIRWLVEEYLRRAGARVVSVSDGAAAVAAVDEAAGNRPFQLVLADIHMPGMDGHEAMRRMREAGYRGVIVALTAQRQAEEGDLWRAAGCDAVASKPIDRRTFIPLLASLLRAKEAAVDRTAAGDVSS
jgi:PAS domain S-box-containing protein